VLTDDGPLAIDVPRDREGTFEPQLIPKHERRFTGFDETILALYARGGSSSEPNRFMSRPYRGPGCGYVASRSRTDGLHAWISLGTA